MENRMNYLPHGKLIHPKVIKVNELYKSRCSPELKIRDPCQPSHGKLLQLHYTTYPS